MTNPETGSHQKPSDIYQGLKNTLGVSHIEMTPFDQLPTAAEFTDVRDRELVHPWHLTHVAPVRGKEHPVAHGIALFASSKLTIADRAAHWVPHVPGPETEHAYLNLVRATARDLGVTAPVEKGVYRHHLSVVPINEPVIVELHNIKQGELAGERRIGAFGVALCFLRSIDTGESLTEAMIQWSDKA